MPRLLDRFGAGARPRSPPRCGAARRPPAPLERIGLRPRRPAARAAAGDRAGGGRRAAGACWPRRSPRRLHPGNGDVVRVTPVTGWANFADGRERGPAARPARSPRCGPPPDHLDLLPVRWTPPSRPRPPRSERAAMGLAVGVDRLRLPVAVPGHPARRGRAALRRLRAARSGRLGRVRRRLLGASWRLSWSPRAAIWVEGFHALDPQRPPDEPARAVPRRDRGDRGVPAQRGGDDPGRPSRRSARGLPRSTCRSWWPTTPRADGGRGRPARDRPAGPAVRAARGRPGQHLQGAERQRRDEPRDRRVRRHVRRRPPPGARRVPARLALAVQRLRRRPGALRDPQRRRVPGGPHGGRRVRGDLRRQPPRACGAARVRRCSAGPTATGAPACWPRPACTASC